MYPDRIQSVWNPSGVVSVSPAVQSSAQGRVRVTRACNQEGRGGHGFPSHVCCSPSACSLPVCPGNRGGQCINSSG